MSWIVDALALSTTTMVPVALLFVLLLLHPTNSLCSTWAKRKAAVVSDTLSSLTYRDGAKLIKCELQTASENIYIFFFFAPPSSFSCRCGSPPLSRSARFLTTIAKFNFPTT